MSGSDGSRENALGEASGRGKGRVPAWANVLLAVAFLYLFLCSIKVMGVGLTTIAKDPGASASIESFMAHATNPFVALTASVLLTALVQSSSFTTSLFIALVGSGQLTIETGVFMVMGANIGTSVTSTIVAIGSVRIRKQFRRAFAAAVVHDVFNLLTVAILFPLEWITLAMTGRGVLARGTSWIAGHLGLRETGGGGVDPVKVITAPVMEWARAAVDGAGLGPVSGGAALAFAGVVLLFVSLALMVMNLKGALLRRIEGAFSKVFFRNDAVAYATGAAVTVLVQSSSITTSLIVPLAGAGTVKLKRVFPYVLGANLGTTVTGLLAALAMPVPAAVTVALAHTAFNVLGAAIWYPMRSTPIGLARRLAAATSERKTYALVYLLGLFVGVPVIGIALSEWLG